MAEKRFALYFNDQIGLIIPKKTGVIITNQTGGVCCHHPEIEGYVVFVSNKLISKKLEDNFNTCGGFSEIDANYIDACLSESSELCNIKVDRSKINDSEEAWVHVIVNDAREDIFSTFCGYKNQEAILTWNNSD